MKWDEVENVEKFIELKVISKIASKLKVGDYIELYEGEFDDDGEKYIWKRDAVMIDAFRSRISDDRNVDAAISPIYRVKVCDPSGYIEACPVSPMPEEDLVVSFFDDGNVTNVTWHIESQIEDMLCDMHFEESDDINEVIDILSQKIVKLDDDYTESIIFESEYRPYSNCRDFAETMKLVQEARDSEHKELLRQRAIRGHETRRRRKEAQTNMVQPTFEVSPFLSLYDLISPTWPKKVKKKKKATTKSKKNANTRKPKRVAKKPKAKARKTTKRKK